jgi:UDP-3-O-[3-hydroxymyristoyl] N-acetylglucosamine deacetylase
MSSATGTQHLTVTGHGLITGESVTVEIDQGPAGQGIVFDFGEKGQIPARLESVVHTDRGVTLANRQGQTLSIVEHFLCACSLAGVKDLTVKVDGAPELPILDGSAQQWMEMLSDVFQPHVPAPIALKQAVFYRHDEHICLYAVPSTHFKVSYAVDFDHTGLKIRWAKWDSREDDVRQIAAARTFGFVRELPLLQAQGLGKGVRPDNTLGMTDEGGYTDALRFDDEPVFHKVLDFMGDMTLSGLNPLGIQAHFFAINAGHGSHTAFARKLLRALK